MSLERLRDATCIVLANGTRTGSGTLVDDRHVVTVSHVIGNATQLAVHFGSYSVERDLGTPAELVPVTVEQSFPDLDLVVLVIADEPDRELPPPARLWPWRRLPSRTTAYGFPLQEKGPPQGVWVESTPTGPLREGRHQVGWGQSGSLPGHSGGPLADVETGQVVGVLTEGSTTGHFDRFVPIAALRDRWSAFPPVWAWGGLAAEQHFAERARGQQARARGGDLFKGRRAALDRVGRWLVDPVGPGVPLVVTAQPGSGKSALLARSIINGRARTGLAFHCLHATADGFADHVCRLLGAETPGSPRLLADQIAALANPPPLLPIVVDALDEAATAPDRRLIADCVRDLARVPWIRAVIATRPLAINRFARGTILHSLGVVHGADSHNLIDLDTDAYFDQEDLLAYVEAILQQEGFDSPGPPAGAWSTYRSQPDLRREVGEAICSRSGRNYLVAALSSLEVSEDLPLDPNSPSFNPDELPSSVGDALNKYLDRLPDDRRSEVLDLLVALAYARGNGFTDDRWLAAASELSGSDLRRNTIEDLRDTPAVDYLTVTTSSGSGAVTRLFHQALADELVAQRTRHLDERAILALLRDEVSGRWLQADTYTREHGAAHALAAGALQDLVSDAEFLVFMEPTGLRSAMQALDASILPPETRAIFGMYDLAYPELGSDPGRNATYLGLVAEIQAMDAVAGALQTLHLPRDLQLHGSIQPFDESWKTIVGHTDTVWSAVPVVLPDTSHPHLVTTSSDGSARVWNPLRAESEVSSFYGHSRPAATALGFKVAGVKTQVLRAATLPWPDLDHHAVVTTSNDGTARIWNPMDGIELRILEGHSGAVNGVSVIPWPPPVMHAIVTVGDDGSARVWDPVTGQELTRFEGHTDVILGVTSINWPNAETVAIATTSRDRTARVWWPNDAARDHIVLRGHRAAVMRASPCRLAGQSLPLLATTSADCSVLLWSLDQPDEPRIRLNGHTNVVWDVIAIDRPDRTPGQLLVTASMDGTARVWEPARAEELSSFTGHGLGVAGLATLAVESYPYKLVVSTSEDTTARIWNPYRQLGRQQRPFTGHKDTVWEVNRVELPAFGQQVIVSTSADRTARIWSSDPDLIEVARFEGHEGTVWNAAAVQLEPGGHTYIATTSEDGTARLWDPLQPAVEVCRVDGHEGPVFGVTSFRRDQMSTSVLVTTSADATIRLWDLAGPAVKEIDRLVGHSDKIWGALVLDADDSGNAQRLVTTSADRTARIWDLSTGQQTERFDGHSNTVWGLTAVDWPGLPYKVVATTSFDRTIRIWDPTSGRELACLGGHLDSVWGVDSLHSSAGDSNLLVTSSVDGSSRIWDLRSPGEPKATVGALGACYGVAALNAGAFAVATARGLLRAELDSL